MADMTWLAQEAKTIHGIFVSLFYGIAGVLLVLSVFLEYFKWPLGAIPSFAPFVGRVLVAAIMLHTFPEVLNSVAEVTDGLAQKLGDLNQFKLVLARMGDKFSEFSWSWVSVKESVILLISFITFFLLYFSVHVADAFLLYTWTLLYVFSPLLIALFVIPQTAVATKALYRSVFEVSAWKIVWSVLATLLWSAALSDLNKTGSDVSFLTAICFNLILAGSLLLTPVVVHALAGSGLATMARTVGSVAVGTTMLGPMKLVKIGTETSKRGYNAGLDATSEITERYFPRAHQRIDQVPRFNVKPRKKILAENKKQKNRKGKKGENS